MPKYRVEFDHKEVRSIDPTEQTTPEQDTFLEEETGETIWAIIEASDDAEAREKAGRLQEELQTRKTKRELRGDARDARDDKGPRD